MPDITRMKLTENAATNLVHGPVGADKALPTAGRDRRKLFRFSDAGPRMKLARQ